MTAEYWHFLDARKSERTKFADLDRTFAMPRELAAPPNTWREVHRISDIDGNYYLKCFRKTQAKNRLSHRLSAPSCGTDAEREARVAAALRERGIATARPVAVGRHGPQSFYLCAEIPGRSLRTLLDEGRLTPRMAREAARFAGSIGAQGVVLTDLSADHVFALPGSPARFAVLDLHNGRLGTPRGRDVLRMFRRTRKSLRGVSMSRRLALSCAIAFLRALGHRGSLHRVLDRVPPLDTHSRYDAPGKSTAYRHRNPSRHRRELRCLDRVWPGRRGDQVLDLPCGVGRISHHLETNHGVVTVRADRAGAMLREATHGHARRVQCDATAMPFADRSFDGVVVFRFLHHLPPEVAHQVLRQAARVARDHVVVSFFHPVSSHGLRRKIRRAVSGRAPTRFTLKRRTLVDWMHAEGFEADEWAAEMPYLREFWIVAFRRVRDPGSG